MHRCEFFNLLQITANYVKLQEPDFEEDCRTSQSFEVPNKGRVPGQRGLDIGHFRMREGAQGGQGGVWRQWRFRAGLMLGAYGRH